MKKFLLVLSLIILIIVSFNIEKSNNNNNSKGKFAIYLVDRDETIEGMEKDINDLTLDESPIITDENIANYDWKKHIINFKKDFKMSPVIGGGIHQNCVVMIGDERIYIGTLFSLASSMRVSDKFPVFKLDDENPHNRLLINDNGVDIDDIRIYNFFKKQHKLKRRWLIFF